MAQANACMLPLSLVRKLVQIPNAGMSFSVKEEVLLSTKNLKLKVVAANARKLLPKFIGPFTVVRRINPVAYELEFPETMKIHNVFHVSLFRPYISSVSYQPPAPTVAEDDQLENTMEIIMDQKDTPYRRNTHRHLFRSVATLRP